MDFVWLAAGLVIGIILGWFIKQSSSGTALGRAQQMADQAEAARVALSAELEGLRQANSELTGKASGAESATLELRKQVEELRQRADALQAEANTLQAERAQLRTSLEESQQRLTEERQLLEQAEVKLKDAFKALSSEALESHQKQFMELARAQLEQFRALMNTDFGKHAQSVEGLTKPLDETMKRYEQQIQAMEKARGEAYGKLDEQLRQLVESESRLQQETGRLVTALRRPQARGAWGELTLRRVVELAGMIEHCDFSEQTTVRDDAGAMLRPDMVIHVPGGRVIPVDAKTPIDAYLTSLEAQDDESREAALAHHAKQLRTQMELLSKKNYWQQFEGAAELVVMFVPGEAFVSAAVQKDPKLIEDGIQNGVVVASPTTLVTLLRAASYGWRQEKLAENARQVSELGKELYERLRVFLDHFDGVGKGLSSAVDRYDKAAGSLESRVLVSARRFKEFGAVDGKDLDEPVQIGHLPRELAAPELDQALPLPEAEDSTQSET